MEELEEVGGDVLPVHVGCARGREPRGEGEIVQLPIQLRVEWHRVGDNQTVAFGAHALARAPHGRDLGGGLDSPGHRLSRIAQEERWEYVRAVAEHSYGQRLQSFAR